MSEDPFPIRDPILERPLPSAPDVEREFLGSIILDNSLIAQAIELIKPSEMYVPSNLRIYKVMIVLFERGSNITPTLIGEELKRNNSLESSGGMSGISNLSNGLPYITTLKHHAKVIKGKAVLRAIVRAGNKSMAEALEEEEEPLVVLNHFQKLAFDIAFEHTPKTFSSLEAITHKSLEKAYLIQESGKALTGIPSGFPDLDALTLGWQQGDFILVAGRPSMGKSSLAISFIVNAAKAGYSVAFFPLEMPEEQIAMRALCMEARIDSQKFRSGFLTQADWGALGDAHTILSQLPVHVDDTPLISVPQMKAKAMRLKAETKKLDMIVVDYLQLMTGEGKGLYEKATNISKSLKGLARELGLPVIALSQLNRGSENRADHRPKLEDLRESGALEQDADVVAFAYRADKYKPANEPKDHTGEVILSKQRNGPCSTVYLAWKESYARFDNLASSHQ